MSLQFAINATATLAAKVKLQLLWIQAWQSLFCIFDNYISIFVADLAFILL
jgi:hypothetical protein